MKRILALLALALFATLNFQISAALAQGSAFTYQGRLTDGTNSANGNYDLRFYLRDASTNGNPVGPTNTVAPVPASNGLFTVTLDFGSNVFTGLDRWLEIGVRTNGGGAFTTLSPRQQLTPTPYAITAENLAPGAGLSGAFSNAVNFSNPGNQFSGNGSGLTNVSSSTLNGLSASNFWQLTGNSGTSGTNNFVGTRDGQPWEVRANNVRGWRLEPTADTPNIIGNPVVNFVSPGMQGVTIGGGGSIATYGAVYSNSVSAFHGTIGGGLGNTIQSNAYQSTIAGGIQNMVQFGAYRSTIGGGMGNSITYHESTIGGGAGNNINAIDSTIAGGIQNAIDAQQSTIGGGGGNQIQSEAAISVIGGGYANWIAPGASGAVISGGTKSSIGPGATGATIAGGAANTNQAGASFIGGGQFNLIIPSGFNAVIGGGYSNLVAGNTATIGGGAGNSALEYDATIGGGRLNTVSGSDSTVGGGEANVAQGTAATIGGGTVNNIGPGASDATIAGGVGNNNQAGASFIGGGQFNLIIPSGFNAVIGGGYSNLVAGNTATIGGGAGNSAFEYDATIGGGRLNTVSGSDSTVGGGANNYAGVSDSTVGGGANNYAAGPDSTVGGGQANGAWGTGATIPGGANNYAGGNYSFAAGRNAQTSFSGSFIWGDGSRAAISTGVNRFEVLASGGVVFYSGGGSVSYNGGGAWSFSSDRNLKENFKPVDQRAVLERLSGVPMTEWNMKLQDSSQKHLGPMAQDFHAAFGLNGSDDTHINTADAVGVALAAIQGLDQKLEETRAENTKLKSRLESLEQLMNKNNGGVK